MSVENKLAYMKAEEAFIYELKKSNYNSESELITELFRCAVRYVNSIGYNDVISLFRVYEELLRKRIEQSDNNTTDDDMIEYIRKNEQQIKINEQKIREIDNNIIDNLIESNKIIINIIEKIDCRLIALERKEKNEDIQV